MATSNAETRILRWTSGVKSSVGNGPDVFGPLAPWLLCRAYRRIPHFGGADAVWPSRITKFATVQGQSANGRFASCGSRRYQRLARRCGRVERPTRIGPPRDAANVTRCVAGGRCRSCWNRSRPCAFHVTMASMPRTRLTQSARRWRAEAIPIRVGRRSTAGFTA